MFVLPEAPSSTASQTCCTVSDVASNVLTEQAPHFGAHEPHEGLVAFGRNDLILPKGS